MFVLSSYGNTKNLECGGDLYGCHLPLLVAIWKGVDWDESSSITSKTYIFVVIERLKKQ